MLGSDEAQRAEAFSGVVATYPGLAPFSKAGLGGNTCCVCRGPRFDVDRYGRLALPNAVTCSVLLYDNAGNRLAEVGAYGNFDSQFINPNAKEAKPSSFGRLASILWQGRPSTGTDTPAKGPWRRLPSRRGANRGLLVDLTFLRTSERPHTLNGLQRFGSLG